MLDYLTVYSSSCIVSAKQNGRFFLCSLNRRLEIKAYTNGKGQIIPT